MLGGILIRDATPEDWPAVWPFLHLIVAAGETFSWDRDITEERARAMWFQQPPGRAVGEHVVEQARVDGYRAMVFNAVVETNTRAVALWRSLGFEILATIPEGFRHPEKGYVGLCVMHRRL